MKTSLRLESASVSDRGLSEKRPQNEDSFLEIPESGIFAVADGVGGAQAGEVASQMAMEILGEAFINVGAGADAEVVMQVALERANSAIHQMSNELSQLSKMATTVVALHLADGIATIGHVGDSRLYRRDADGNLIRETDDHSMVADEVRAGRMSEEQAENHPGKNIINRALGAESTVDIDLKTIMVGHDSTFLICSDGVTRHISDGEINDLLGSGDAPDVICGRIKEICYERGAEDNLTAVIVRVAAFEADVADDQAVGGPIDLPSIHDDEEITIATFRPYIDDSLDDDADELLELDTAELAIPSELTTEPDILMVSDDPILETGDGDTQPNEFAAEFQTSADESAGDTADEGFSMFGNSGGDTSENGVESSGLFGKIASSVGLLLIGALIGLGAYHLLLVPPTVVETPPVIVAQSENIAFSSFEKSRRHVDKDPSGFITKFAEAPEVCEDYYLLGRAYLLTGEYIKSRASLGEARKQLASCDPINSKTIETEIVLAMTVLNDPGNQGVLKKELDATKSLSNSATNTNAK